MKSVTQRHWKMWLAFAFLAVVVAISTVNSDRREAQYVRSEQARACFAARVTAEKRRFGEAGVSPRRIAAIFNGCAIHAGDPARAYPSGR
jgi:hypothetical protein